MSRSQDTAAVGAATSFKLSRSSVKYGSEQLVRLTAITKTVRDGSPTGNVVVKQGSRVLCVITLRDDIGSCRLSPDQLDAGTYQITADYLGNTAFRPYVATAKLTVVV